jgi:hypothetical protein
MPLGDQLGAFALGQMDDTIVPGPVILPTHIHVTLGVEAVCGVWTEPESVVAVELHAQEEWRQ